MSIFESQSKKKNKTQSTKRQESKWAELKNKLQDKTSLESSVNLLRKTTIEKFQTECHQIYKKKLKIRYFTNMNSQLLVNTEYQNITSVPSIHIKDGSQDLIYSEFIKEFLFQFRSNNKLMIDILNTLNQEESTQIASFLCHFFYENFYSDSSEQEEIIYIIYLLLEQEIYSMNTPSFISFIDGNFLYKFLSEFIKSYEIKTYINRIFFSLIRKLESLNSEFLSLEVTKKSKNQINDEIITSTKESHSKKKKNNLMKKDYLKYSEFLKGEQSVSFISKNSTTTFWDSLIDEVDFIVDIRKEAQSNITESQLRKRFGDEFCEIKKELIFKHMRKSYTMKNNNLYSIDMLISSLKRESNNLDNIKNYLKGVKMIKKFITELFNELDRDIIIPYSVKCICKIIGELIDKKFNDLNKIDKNNFICAFFFEFIIFPVLLNPDTTDLSSKMIISMNTRKNLINIYRVLKTLIYGNLFSNDFTLTIFNTFIIDNYERVDKIIQNASNTKLPYKIQELISLFYKDETFHLDHSKKEEQKLINYDYFEENPNDFMRHQSICFNLENLLLLIEKIRDKESLFEKYGSEFMNSYLKLNEIKEKLEILKKENTFYVILNDTFINDMDKLLGSKENPIPLYSKYNDSCITAVKYCISFLLSKLNFSPHNDWYTGNIPTEQFFDAIYTFTNCSDSIENQNENEIPLSWYAFYIKTNLVNLPENYIKNDYEEFYKEIVQETKDTINTLKKANNFLTIQMTTKVECLKQKINITKNELSRTREKYLNIKLLYFVETEKIRICLCRVNQLLRDNPFSQIIKTDKVIILNKVEECPHLKYHNLLRKLNQPLPQNKTFEEHISSILGFVQRYSSFIDLFTDLKSEKPNEPKNINEVFHEYMNIVREHLEANNNFFIPQINNDQNSTITNSFDKKNEKIVLEKYTVEDKNNSIMKNQQRVMEILKNYILQKIYSRFIQQEPPINDDIVLLKHCIQFSWVDPYEHLYIPKEAFDSNIFESIKEHLINMDLMHNPEEKLEEFACSVQDINNMFAFTINQKRIEPSDILPMIIFALIQIRPKRLTYGCRFIKYFLTDEEKISHKGYNVIQAESAIKYINNLNEEKLNVTKSEYNENCRKAFESESHKLF